MSQHPKLFTAHLIDGICQTPQSPGPETPHQAGKGAYGASHWTPYVQMGKLRSPSEKKHHRGSVAGLPASHLSAFPTPQGTQWPQGHPSTDLDSVLTWTLQESWQNLLGQLVCFY